MKYVLFHPANKQFSDISIAKPVSIANSEKVFTFSFQSNKKLNPLPVMDKAT